MILFDEVSQFLVMAKIPVDPLSPKVISRMYLTTARWTVEKGALLGAQSFFFSKNGRTCHCPRMVHFQKYHNGKHDPFKVSWLFLKTNPDGYGWKLSKHLGTADALIYWMGNMVNGYQSRSDMMLWYVWSSWSRYKAIPILVLFLFFIFIYSRMNVYI